MPVKCEDERTANCSSSADMDRRKKVELNEVEINFSYAFDLKLH